MRGNRVQFHAEVSISKNTMVESSESKTASTAEQISYIRYSIVHRYTDLPSNKRHKTELGTENYEHESF